MTDKKEKILFTALELFANEGFNGTSTSKIAQAAGVSEGLIFKHFENKKGLLNALIQESTEKANAIFSTIISQMDARKVIAEVVEMPFEIPKQEYPFWKLQFKLKWENDYDKGDKMKPLIDKLTWAFNELNYKEPKKEAAVLNHIIENISIGILRDGIASQNALKDFLIDKYLK